MIVPLARLRYNVLAFFNEFPPRKVYTHCQLCHTRVDVENKEDAMVGKICKNCFVELRKRDAHYNHSERSVSIRIEDGQVRVFHTILVNGDEDFWKVFYSTYDYLKRKTAKEYWKLRNSHIL